MSDKTIYKFVGSEICLGAETINEEIESRGYKKAVKSFQNKFPKLKEVMVEWIKNGINLSKLQKLPLGRKKKLR
tara:strand:+ start:840 stop:1061 length:222 start_codon:yes stop_codon:yes gene_type:complete